MEVQELKEQIAEILENHVDTRCLQELPSGEFRPLDLTEILTTSILSLLDSPDSPYVLKSEITKRIREIENPYKDDDVKFYAPFELAFNSALQKAVELFEEKK